MCSDYVRSDVEAIYYHTTSLQKEISGVLENMFPVLVASYVIIANVEVHKLKRV
jgi:hypothetical protein